MSISPPRVSPRLRTETLTMDSKVRKGAIDSMADGSGEIPDPELHEWSIADAIDQGRPALVLFGTPAYCESQFCGPEVTELQRLARRVPRPGRLHPRRDLEELQPPSPRS